MRLKDHVFRSAISRLRDSLAAEISKDKNIKIVDSKWLSGINPGKRWSSE